MRAWIPKPAGWIVGACTVVFALGARAVPPAPAATFDQVVAQAKKEGQLNLWWEVPGEQDVLNQWQAAFKKRFGFNLQVNVTPLPSRKGTPRFVTEARAGRVDVDLLYVSEPELIFKDGLLQEFALAETFGDKLPDLKAAVQNTPSHRRGYSVDIATFVYGMVYNTKRTKPEELPKTLEEFAAGKGFADPKWRGNFVVNSTGPASPLSDLAANGYWSVEKVKKTIQLLLANKPLLKRGSGDMRLAVATGEVAAGMGSIGGTIGLAKQGYPIEMAFFDDVLFYGATQMAIPKKAKHPAAALLYLAFILQDGLPIVDRTLGEGTIADPRAGISKLLEKKPGAKRLEWSAEDVASGKREEIRNDLMKLLP